MEIRLIDEDELPALVEIVRVVDPDEAPSVAGFVDWRRQADDMAWVLATASGAPVGAGVALVGWHAPPGTGRARVWTLPDARGRGVGGGLLAQLTEWLSARSVVEVESAVREDDPTNLGWAGRRGFREAGRSSLLVLDLSTSVAPAIEPPPGITVAQWSERDGIEAGLYRVYGEAEPDIPGEEHNELPSLEDWLADDMDGASDRRDAVFVAFAGDEVVGYAKLSIPPEGGDTAYHDLAGVLRAWRGRGIAGALKRAQIAWATEQGFTRLVTSNEERNEPIRRLNQRHGYVAQPGSVRLVAPLAALRGAADPPDAPTGAT